MLLLQLQLLAAQRWPLNHTVNYGEAEREAETAIDNSWRVNDESIGSQLQGNGKSEVDGKSIVTQ
jgi:hypothetical protein